MQYFLLFLDCNQIAPIGISNGFIASSRFLSSTTYSSEGLSNIYWAPGQARLKTGSCWCGALNSWQNDWLQVDLQVKTMLKGIAIQGDPLDPPNDVKEFYVQTSNDGNAFQNLTEVTNKYGSNIVSIQTILIICTGMQIDNFNAST